MKLLLLIAIALVAVKADLPDLCDTDVCRTPNCRCSSNELDPNIDISETPQLVIATFDDAVTKQIAEIILPIFEGKTNPDGCPAQLTYFNSHEYTDYSKVHELWSKGHELAMHSISHSPYTDYWKSISMENLTMEFGDQRKIISHFGLIPEEDIKGIRVPLFQLSGDNTFKAIQELGLTYDSSWPTQQYADGLWPYSLDYASEQDCPLDNCPVSSIPGVWVNPIPMWQDINGVKCAMVDACQTIPSASIEELLEWMKSNFRRVYEKTRAPFGLYLHAAWFFANNNHLEAYKQFISYLNEQPDVYLVSASRAVEFARNPKAITGSDKKIFDQCQKTSDNTCFSKLCALKREDTNEERYMTQCTACPAVYPWKGNPQGIYGLTQP